MFNPLHCSDSRTHRPRCSTRIESIQGLEPSTDISIHGCLIPAANPARLLTKETRPFVCKLEFVRKTATPAGRKHESREYSELKTEHDDVAACTTPWLEKAHHDKCAERSGVKWTLSGRFKNACIGGYTSKFPNLSGTMH